MHVQAHSARWASVLTTALLALLTACSGGEGPTDPGGGENGGDDGSATVSRVEVSPDSTTMDVLRDTVQFEAAALDEQGDTIDGVTFSWSTTYTSVISLSSSGEATAINGGQASVIASAEGTSDTAQATASVVVSGTAFSPTAASPSTMRFVLELTETNDTLTSDIDNNGEFEVRTERPIAGTPARIYLEPTEDTPPKFSPALIPDTIVMPDRRLQAVLFPLEWPIKRGSLSGTQVSVDPQTVYAFPNASGEFYANWHREWSVWRDQRGSSPELTRTTAWPKDSFPIPTYLNHSAGDTLVFGTGGNKDTALVVDPTPEDSTAIWDHIAGFEKRFGMDLFRPATKSSLQGRGDVSETDQPAYSIKITIAEGLPANLGGSRGGQVSQFPDDDEVIGGIYLAPDRGGVLQWRIVQHELLHALALSHSCFPGQMTNCRGEFPFQDLPRITEDGFSQYDIAYTKLYWAMHRLIAQHDAEFGAIEALNGYRVLRMGKDPLPEWWLASEPQPSDAEIAGPDMNVRP